MSTVTAFKNVASGQKTVAVAGTAEPLQANGPCKTLTLKALLSNTDKIYVGASSVDSTNGFELVAGETLSLDVTDTNVVYIDAVVSGEGASFIYLEV